MQGKELEEILKGEGVIEPEEEDDDKLADEDDDDIDLQLVEGIEGESQKESDEENPLDTVVVS